MQGLGCLVLAVSVSCGSPRPPAPAPAAQVAVKPAVATPVAVAKPPEPSKPVLPDTAAGHTLAAWLDAFNSGDAARMKEVVERYKDPMGFRIVNYREET